jgi:HAD superfamily hydrolase (TIGR01490 family)
MVENNIVDEQEFRARNEIYYQDYQRGTLDNEQYLEFALKPLTQYSIEELYAWRADYVENWIKPIVAPGARELLDNHRNQNHELLIISATHLFVTAPIAQLLGVPTVLSTEPEIIDNRYTGRYLGIPTYQEGKVTALYEWLSTSVQRMDGSYFYSDSINDLALLEKVDHPITVHPDEQLEAIAGDRGWPIINLH